MSCCPISRLDPFREQRAELVRLEGEIDFAAVRGDVWLAEELAARAHVLRAELAKCDSGLTAVDTVLRNDGPCPDCGDSGVRTRLRRGSSYRDTEEVTGPCQCAAGRALRQDWDARDRRRREETESKETTDEH